MDHIIIEAKKNSPAVDFNFEANRFSLNGMSYMEDTREFYGDLIARLETHFDSAGKSEIRFDVNLPYFNSSSARIVLRIFDMVDKAAGNGANATIYWHHGDDEDVEEQGEEFAEDLVNASFVLVGTDGAPGGS